MDKLDYPDESFGVVWSEGAAYVIGWEQALMSWKRLVKPGGVLVATECCWLSESPSDVAVEFWGKNYPRMLTSRAATDVATANGFEVIATYTLPAGDWFDEYYNPIKKRHAMLSEGADEDMKQAIASGRREIELYEKHGDEYDYVGFVLKNK